MGDTTSSDFQKQETASNGSGCRCVVLVPPDGPRPQALLKGLEKRGARYEVAAHPVQVMVRLAVGEPRVLVVDHPERIDQLQQLLAAVRRYYPRVVCWRYTAKGSGGQENGGLTRFDDLPAPPIQPARPPASDPIKQPVNGDRRLVSQSDGGERTGPKLFNKGIAAGISSGGGFPLSEPLLTAEELSMLIGPRFGEGDDSDSPGDLDTEPNH